MMRKIFLHFLVSKSQKIKKLDIEPYNSQPTSCYASYLEYRMFSQAHVTTATDGKTFTTLDGESFEHSTGWN